MIPWNDVIAIAAFAYLGIPMRLRDHHTGETLWIGDADDDQDIACLAMTARMHVASS